MWSAVQGACSSLALRTSVIRVLCQALDPTAFLVHPVLAAIAEESVPAHSSATDSTWTSSELCRRPRPVPQIIIFVFLALTQSFLLHCFFPNQETPDTFLEWFNDDNKVIGIRAELVWQGFKHNDEEQQAEYRVFLNTNLHFKLFTVPLINMDMAPLISIHPLHQSHNPNQVFSVPTWWPFKALHQNPSPGLQKSWRVSCLQLDTLTDAWLQRLHLLCFCQGQSQTGNRRLTPTVWWGSPQSSQHFHDLLYQLYTALVSPFPCIPLNLVEADNETAPSQRVPCHRKWLQLRGHRSCRRPYHQLLLLSPPLCLMSPVLSRLHLRDGFLKPYHWWLG